MAALLRERERDYFSVVTGTHHGTKTPPDETMRRGMTRLGSIFKYSLEGMLPGLVRDSVGPIGCIVDPRDKRYIFSLASVSFSCMSVY